MTDISSAVRAAKRTETREAKRAKTPLTADSIQNFAHNLGIGTDNPTSSTTYGFNPITRQRMQLEWMHRGSWVAGMAVDVVADDMSREGIEILSTLKPDDMEEIANLAIRLNIWPAVGDTIRWGRLYGGAIGVLLVDGQKMDTELNIDTIAEGQFRGILPLDRWMVEPSLSELVTELGPDLGLPMFYTVNSAAPALVGQKIHYSRVIRAEGDRLPYQQRLTEQLWGSSVIERIYDRMVAFDSATQGAGQLVFRIWLRTLSVEGLRELIATGGQALKGLVGQLDFMRRYQTNEGLTLIDAADKFETHQHSALGGLADVLLQFAEQLSGALQIPLVRFLGQSPAGLNSTGDSDLRNYYGGIKTKQESRLRTGVMKVYRCIAASAGIELPKNFNFEFRSLHQLTDEQKAETANKITDTVVKAEEAGIVRRKTALQELRQASRVTGVWSNISDEDIEEAEDDPPPADEALIDAPPLEEGEKGAAPSSTKDSVASSFSPYGRVRFSMESR